MSFNTTQESFNKKQLFNGSDVREVEDSNNLWPKQHLYATSQQML